MSTTFKIASSYSVIKGAYGESGDGFFIALIKSIVT